jgi:hypothetical protein
MPAFRDFLDDHGEDGPMVLAVNIMESPAAIQNFFITNSLDFIPVLLDSEGRVDRDYNIHNLPTTFVIDPEGTAVGRNHLPGNG